jgi:hypothetical protein
MDKIRFQRMASAHGVEYDLEEVFGGEIRGLLTTNQKVEKGEKAGWLTAIMHLSPAKASGFQVCSSATKGCEAACLNTAGRGGIFRVGEADNSIQRKRRLRTAWYFARRNEFLRQLDSEISTHTRRAARKGFQPAVRLNGTSDIRWETVKLDGKTLFERHPNVVFYDYTKHSDRDVSDIPNYSLTFSLAENNDSKAVEALANGLNVAAVFHTVPETFMGRPVFDGDASDLRFLDPSGVIVGLKAKGKARQDRTSGFVR